MDEDPSNEAFVLSLLEGYGADEAEAMDVEPAPSKVDVTPDFTGKTECISYVRQDHLHTHDRQNESNTIAVIKRTRV
jgi:hypothetical protein